MWTSNESERTSCPFYRSIVRVERLMSQDCIFGSFQVLFAVTTRVPYSSTYQQAFSAFWFRNLGIGYNDNHFSPYSVIANREVSFFYNQNSPWTEFFVTLNLKLQVSKIKRMK